MEEIKLCKKRGSPSESSEITVVVSSVADNIGRVFPGLADIRRGFTESVTYMQERVNTIYSDAREVCDQLGATNPGEKKPKDSVIWNILFTQRILGDFSISNLEFLHVRKF